MQHAKTLFIDKFPFEWESAEIEEKESCIIQLLESLEISTPAVRYDAAKMLLYVALGNFEEISPEDHLEAMVDNNTLIFKLGALPTIAKSLKVVSAALDVIIHSPDEDETATYERQCSVDLANAESSVYLSLLFLMCEILLDDELFGEELASMEIPLVAGLFDLVAQLAEGNRKHYPVKKLLLVLWKALVASLGSFSNLRVTKNAARIIAGLPEINFNDLYLKSTPQDLCNFSTQCSIRYPGYMLPDAISVLKETTNFPYSTLSRLFDSATIPNSLKRYMQLPPTLQPSSGEIPVPVKEQYELIKKHMYISLGALQIADEKFIHDNNGKIYNFNELPKVKLERIKEKEQKKLERIEVLYSHLVGNMGTHVGMLVRLLYYVNLGNNNNPTSQNETQNANTGNEEQQALTPEQTLDRLDLNRHKEVVTKAVAGILLVLLKATKCSHVLKSEYISQLLCDNNCAILILKMLSTWFQQPNNKQNQVPGQEKQEGTSWENGTNPASLGMGAALLRDPEEPEALKYI
ncbi:Factor arrest protein 11 [Nowakowskiella sp. JEL0078]|nr:Factor arrest protein 11 [Nowakowskiella sp. JEL0078]